jgi:serine/threonine protein kinase
MYRKQACQATLCETHTYNLALACKCCYHAFFARQMVTGHTPWSVLHFRTLVDLAKGMQQHRMPPIPSCLSDHLQHILRSCFIWTPVDRPTARELLLHDFCRAVHCRKCVGESLCDDHGYNGACCENGGSSCSDSRRSSDCSDDSVDTQTVSSESSNTEQSSLSDRVYCAPPSLHGAISWAAVGSHSAVSPSANWSDCLAPSTTTPAAPEVVSTSSTAAVCDGPRRKDAGALEEASRRAAGSLPSTNPFAGRIRVTASVNSACVSQTKFGTSVLEPAVI